jgi:hypothetical protein
LEVDNGSNPHLQASTVEDQSCNREPDKVGEEGKWQEAYLEHGQDKCQDRYQDKCRDKCRAKAIQ